MIELCWTISYSYLCSTGPVLSCGEYDLGIPFEIMNNYDHFIMDINEFGISYSSRTLFLTVCWNKRNKRIQGVGLITIININTALDKACWHKSLLKAGSSCMLSICSAYSTLKEHLECLRGTSASMSYYCCLYRNI